MGKVQYGGGVVAITGSIGGWTFQRNRAGTFVRIRSGTLKSSTSKQTSAHQNLISFQQGWQAITAEKKQAWNVFADAHTRTDRYGTVKILTGLNWYASINYYRVLAGESVLSTPPAYTLPTAVQDYNYAVRSTDILLNFSPAFNPADNALLIFTTPFTSRITTSLRQQMRLTKIINTGPFGFIDLTSDWETTHGISWPPSNAPICGRVGIMVQTIKKSSGISSTALIKTNGLTTDQEGIGYMSISNDFIIRPGIPYDSDVQTFIDAVYAAGGSLSSLEENAVNVYVLDAKNNANAWWNDTHADYPMLGSTKDSCKVNLKNPGTFNLDFINTIAGDFSATGWNPNGTTSYAKTGLVPSVVLTIQKVILEYYSRQTSGVAQSHIGAIQDPGKRLLMYLRGGVLSLFDAYTQIVGNGRTSRGNVSAIGGHTFTRTAANDARIFRNGIQNGATDATGGGVQPTIELYLGANNTNGVPAGFCNRENAGALIGDGFTPAQALAQYTARQIMNTTLSREV